ncbi:MAG: divalent cation tolerance protein CutA [Phycisphaerae bacterium]|nr:divalent cation tolerance protein CutA [Phycisphaerae bacterium]
MKNKDFFALLSTCPDAATAERLGRALVEASLAACVNGMPGLRSNVVAQPVADGHHPYLSWVASSTRAP